MSIENPMPFFRKKKKGKSHSILVTRKQSAIQPLHDQHCTGNIQRRDSLPGPALQTLCMTLCCAVPTSAAGDVVCSKCHNLPPSLSPSLRTKPLFC